MILRVSGLEAELAIVLLKAGSILEGSSAG
jgi:hypothetical protein